MTGGSGGAADNADGSPLDALQHKLEQLAQEREHLQAMLEQYEADNGSLEARLREAESSLAQLRRQHGQLQDTLAAREEELVATQQKLDEREGLLANVMSFLQGKGDGDEAGNADAAAAAAASGTGPGSLVQQVREQLDLAAQERSLLLAQLTELQAALLARTRELEALRQSSSDRIDELEAELAVVTAERNRLEADLSNAHAELQALRDQLAELGENMQLAARAGLSLTEMLHQLKQQHADREAELLARIAELQKQLEAYEARLARLRDLFPAGDGDGEGDLLDQLRYRLETALATQKQLEDLLEATENSLQAALDELAAVKADRDRMAALLKTAEVRSPPPSLSGCTDLAPCVARLP
jgi:chromosome segregation ATPase